MAKSDIKAGGAFIELFLKDGRFVKGLRGAQKRLQTFGSSVMQFGGAVAGFGAAILGPLSAAVNHFSNAGDALGKMSARTGIAASALAELGFAAAQGGASIDDVEKGVRRMQRTIVDADMGMASAADALAALGLSAGKLKSMKPEDQFQTIADQLAGIDDATRRAAIAQMIFGRSGTQLLPMLSSLREVREEARARGLVPTDEAVRGAEALNDAFGRVKMAIAATAFEVGASLLPILLPALEIVAKIGTATINWVRENGQLIRTIAMIGAGIVAAGTVVTALGLAIFGVGAAFGVLATVVSTVAGLVALIISPVGLVVAGIVAATAAWVKFTESGQAAFTAFKNIIGDIATGLLEGDLQGAWDTVVMGMAAGWDAFAAGMVSVFADAVNIILGLWNRVTATANTALSVLETALRARGMEGAANLIGQGRAGLGAVAGVGTAGLRVASSAASSVEAALRNKAAKSAEDFAERVSGGGERFSAEINELVGEITGLFGELSTMGKFGDFAGLGDGFGGLAAGAASTVTFSGAGLLASAQGAGGPVVRGLDKIERVLRDSKKVHEKTLDKLSGDTFV